ncbi:MAG: hypothetical protein ACK4K7_11665 [Allosphingosinicella sp.]|uniref:hypothetical protein n=1 Tax=Allosphingosinicella sp. TaxID=2823234 RepID=UPI00393071C5
MLMKREVHDFPSRDLFPGWRGHEPLAERLPQASVKLHDECPGLARAVAALPFARFEEADRVIGPVRKYNAPARRAAALADGLDPEVRPYWLCALLLSHVSRFEARFAETGLDGEFALHYRDHFHRILDQIDADPAFADLAQDSFLKDLWLARMVMIPAFAQVWWPHSGISAKAVLRAGSKAAAYVFLGCGGRKPFLEGHTHDPVARAYWNEAGWREALRLAALALPALPAARGVFGTAWFYDPQVREISPRIAFAQDLQVGKGALHIEIGSNEDAVRNATATSAERRNRYREGSYLPTDFAVIWSRRAIAAAYGA